MLAPRAVLIATGSEPVIPPIEGLAEAAPLTTDTVWGLETLPARLVILGAGPIGCELGQAFSRLGSSVTVIEMDARVLPREDPEVGELIAGRLRHEGVDLRTDAKAVRVERCGSAPRRRTRRCGSLGGRRRSGPPASGGWRSPWPGRPRQRRAEPTTAI